MIELSAAAIFGPDFGREEAHAERVQAAIESERVKREARRLLDAEERGPVTPPVVESLRARLARPRAVTPWRIEGWQPQGTRAMLAAQFKAGKTTLIGNLIRSLVDGDPFLGAYSVRPIDGSVVLLDFEMGNQLDDWLQAQRIQNDDRVIVVPMRGRAAAFNILDPETRAEWARRLALVQCSYLIADCVRPIMDGLGLDEHRDAGRLLVSFDALLSECNVTEGVLVHHMGHTGERSRGDSRLRDWPDVEWRLVRQDDEPASPRFITAYGRDVSVPESQIDFDAESRRLTIAGGSRQDAKATGALGDILAVLEEAGAPLSGRAIKRALLEADSDLSKQVIDDALKAGSKNGTLVQQSGPRNSKVYLPGSSVPVSRSVPAVSRDIAGHPVNTSVPVSRPLYRGGTRGHSTSVPKVDDAGQF